MSTGLKFSIILIDISKKKIISTCIYYIYDIRFATKNVLKINIIRTRNIQKK